LERGLGSGVNPLEQAVIEAVEYYLQNADLKWINKGYVFFSVACTASIPGLPVIAGLYAYINDFKTKEEVGKWLFSLITSIPGPVGLVINVVNIILNLFFCMFESHQMTTSKLAMKVYPGKRLELREKMFWTELLLTKPETQFEVMANALTLDSYKKLLGVQNEAPQSGGFAGLRPAGFANR